MAKATEDRIVPDWPAPPNVHALITTRNGGVSQGPYRSLNLGTHVGDECTAVAQNRRRVRAYLPAEPRWLNQVHGSRVVAAETVLDAVEADAAFTQEANVVCVVMVADCLPVLLCDREGRTVAIAHAGWRGLAGGVVESAVAACDCAPKDMMAYLGPAIGPTAFEVGADVRDTFVGMDARAEAAFTPHAPGKWLADIFLLAQQRLAGAGICAIYGGELCTYSQAQQFFSHRRDKVSGRMAAFIWLTR